MVEVSRKSSENWLAGGGEMGSYLRSRLTSTTGDSDSLQVTLGALETWSQSLKTALGILLNVGHPAFLVWGSDRILFYNDAYSSLLKKCNVLIPCGESVKQHWGEEWHQVQTDIEQVFVTQQLVKREHELFPANPKSPGTTLMFCWSYSPLWNENEQVAGVFATGCQLSEEGLDQASSNKIVSDDNVSSVIASEVAPRQSEQRLQLLIDALPVFISYADFEQRYQFVNKAYETHFGLSRSKICGHYTRDIIGETNYALVRGYIERALAGEEVHYEVTVPHTVLGERHLSVMLVPDLDEQTQVRGYFALIIDVTNQKHLEQELIKSRDFRELIFNQAGDALFLVDAETLRTIDCNQQAVELFAVSGKEELIHIEGHILQKRQFTPEEIAMIQREINEKGCWNLEVEYVTRQGREFWGDLSIKQLTFGDQRFNLVRVTDISDRKAVELALQQSEARYLSILEDQTELITRFKSDGTLLFVNDAYCRHFGVSKDQIIGQNYKPLIYPDDQPAIDRCLATLSPESPVGVVENRIFAGGKVRWSQWTNRAIFDSQGNLIELQSVGRDIQERKQAEMALRQSEQKFKGAFNTITTGMAFVSLTGGFQEVNNTLCQKLGYSEAELLALRLEDVEHPLDRQVDFSLAERMMAGEIPGYKVEKRFLHKDGHPLWGLLTIALMHNANNQFLYFIVSITDISDRKEAELKIQAALAEKEVLLQEVYHRVKNNLQLIQSMLQMQQRRLIKPEAIQALQDSRNRVMAISLVHEILYQSDNLAQINLKGYIPTLVQHITASYHSIAPAVVVTTQVEPIVVPMKKAICCGLILNELVTNALKYAFPNGRAGQVLVELSIDYSESKNTIILTVKDNGVGLTDPLHIASSKTLGLSLVQDFVDQLRGAIVVESNQGSVFRVMFEL